MVENAEFRLTYILTHVQLFKLCCEINKPVSVLYNNNISAELPSWHVGFLESVVSFEHPDWLSS